MIIDQNCQAFVNDLLDEYMKVGFGVLSKRDVEILLFHLLYEHGYFGSTPSFFEISRQLRISETRVRNLYADVQLRYDLYPPAIAMQRLTAIIEDQRFEAEYINGRMKYRFQIREPLLRQYMEEWVEQVKGISDSAFSPTIIVISREVFLNLLDMLSPDLETIKARIAAYNEQAEHKLEFEEDTEDTEDTPPAPEKKKFISRFLETYFDTIAEETAKATFLLAAAGIKVILGI